jgi:Outer membrane protein beta-barrel domain
MKKMKFFLTLISLIWSLQNATSQSLTLKVGANFNRTIRAADPDIPNLTVDDFSPKNGYQAGLIYKHPLYKSFFVDAEVGYLNKGHERRFPRTRELLNTVNYNYLVLTPSVGCDLPFGFSLKMGLSINYLLNTPKFTFGDIDRTQYALSTTLAYNYKRFGLEISHNNNVKTMQRFEDFGIKFENYHEWYAASLSFQIFKKQAKTP